MPDEAQRVRSRFKELAGLTALPQNLSIVQFGAWWRSDDVLRVLASELDRLIFESFLTGVTMTVRRLVLYDIPSDEGGSASLHQKAAANHSRWVASLVRDLYYLGMPQRQDPAPYRVKQLILGRIDHERRMPLADDWGDGSPGAWQNTFEQLWCEPRCIENNLLPAEFPVGPAGDRDFRTYLWQ